ncbi:Pectinesterase domain-containing protein/PMEI domain-containing protein [Cephalotus follicularis]|uniref:Pectinesterase n=1 Tax=Cephalotus follicularis TaxID=3775 RepID=A0A1Q3ASD6_CEPFO|nr:Pectinesterase domain-containing protein/PMEI domain-containing protein [Cephalotus follicularis]
MHKLVLALLSSYLLIFPVGSVHEGTVKSCNQAPYPNVCNHYINSNVNETESSFRYLSLKVTMEQAVRAHRLMSTVDVSSFDERAELAWIDCWELYEDTINKLNRSLSSNSPTDTQTWLSAAIANQQTCQNGFSDFNLSSHLKSLSYMIGDFSKLLINSLAINKVTVSSFSVPSRTKQVGGRSLLGNDFPYWVSAADRKLLRSTEAAPKAHIVVAKDGSGNYMTISEALAEASELGDGSKRLVIYVKAGVYNENVVISRSMTNLMFIGDGIDVTVVTGNKNARYGSTTFRSATFSVSGDGFIARDMTFENTAGPQNQQAVALLCGSDLSVFYSCSIKGYQDTLYVYSQRQFYRNCEIYGTIDFIFGDAVAVLQNCNIYVRKPMSGQKNTITAQGRTDPNENTGIVIHDSSVMASTDLLPVEGSYKTYLGRPWQKYSRTVFMKSFLDRLIDPAGWLPWSGDFALSTLYYGEYMNTGSGADTSGRVKWPGYHPKMTTTDARMFTVGNFLAGDSWIPATGVPFHSGL